MAFIKNLKLSKICRGFTYREIAAFAHFLKEEVYKRGEIIFREKDEGDKLFILVKGEVGIRSILLGTAGEYIVNYVPGDFFGELSLFGAGPRRVTAVALADNTICFSISRDDFQTMCSSEPFVSYKILVELIGMFSEKLKASKNDINELLGSLKQA